MSEEQGTQGVEVGVGRLEDWDAEGGQNLGVEEEWPETLEVVE